MLIRVATTRADIPRTGEGIAFVHGEIEPKISAMDGNRGFAMAVDRSFGRYVGIAAWSDPKALEESGHSAPGLIAELARRLHGSKPLVEVFDLVIAEVVKPVRVGYWGGRARLEVPVQDFDRALRRFKETVLAMFERYDGLASIILIVDQPSGVLENIIWYDSLAPSGPARPGPKKCERCSSRTYRQLGMSSILSYRSLSQKCSNCSSVSILRTLTAAVAKDGEWYITRCPRVRGG